jgi:hypothetical protein
LGSDPRKIQIPHRVYGHLPGALTAQTPEGRVLIGHQGRTNEGAPDLLGKPLRIRPHGVTYLRLQSSPATHRYSPLGESR